MFRSDLQQAMQDRGISRRDFVKFCTVMTGVLALPHTLKPKVVAALESPVRTPVIWLEFQDCAGCSESFLRSSRPSAADVVLDVLSVDYHETIMAASGFQAEEAMRATMDAGGYLLVVEGAVPTAEDGIYCTVGGKAAVDTLKKAAAGAIAVVAVGNCATFGGIPKASPNPTSAVGVMDLVTDKPVLNLPGCPMNVVNLTATVVHFLTFGALPDMDDLHRPLFAYGARIHDNCERRGHFDAGEFVRAWGDEGHRKGWCLYQMGCKGPVSYHNCPAVRWNEGTSWPVQAGHGCIGCSEPGFWELGAYNTATILDVVPPSVYAPVQEPVKQGISSTGAGVIGGLVGLAAGAAGVTALRQANKAEAPEEPTPEE